MKSKLKTKIDFSDLADVRVAQGLTEFLILIDIKNATVVADEVQEWIEEEFCANCEVDLSNCECHRDEGRYMREYDDGADYED